MLGLLKKMFGAKPVETTTEVPYKVEAAVDTADIAIAQLPIPAAEVKAEPEAPAKKAPVKKVPAKKTAAPKVPRKPKTSQ